MTKFSPKQYYCEDCRCRFSIHSRHGKGVTINCPICSDWVRVKRIIINVNQKWSEEETAMIDKVLEKKMSVYEVQAITNRSLVSVQRKLARRRRELNEII